MVSVETTVVPSPLLREILSFTFGTDDRLTNRLLTAVEWRELLERRGSMAIWTYDEGKASDMAFSFQDQLYLENCGFCASQLLHLAGANFSTIGLRARAAERYGICDDYAQLRGCPVCGWWVCTLLTGRAPFKQHDDGYLNSIDHVACCESSILRMCQFQLKNCEAIFLRKYGDRFDVHPRKFEEIVGSVFADFGFRVRVTSYSGDGGIDVVVFDGKNDVTTGIQVKRQRGKVNAEQIRSFRSAPF
jgi:hypothetical protein